jgi:Zonular occludens toxin (Zot)
MIVYVNGNIGSGKTSLAVAFLYAFFPNKVYDSLSFLVKKFFPHISGIKKDKLKIYTNISGFKFDDFDGKAEFLNFDILSQCAKIHYEIHLTNKDNRHIDKAINSFFDQCAKGVEFDDLETDLNLTKVRRKYDYIKGFQFNHIILLIDEVGDYFVKGEPYLDKWFNYSRHLYQDMILIQNDLSSIDKSYKNDNVVSYYIKASEASSRLHPQLFKYAFFRKWTQPVADKPSIKMFWIPTWIFDKYDSGQAEKAFPRIILYLIPFIALLVHFLFQLYGFIFVNEEVVDNNITTVKEKIIDSNSTSFSEHIESKKNKHNKTFICFRCRSNTCFYKKEIFTFNRLSAYMDFYDFEFAYKDTYPSFSDYCFIGDKSFVEMYDPKQVKNKSSSNSLTPVRDKDNYLSAEQQR